MKLLFKNLKFIKGIAGLNNAGRSNEGLRRLVWMLIFLIGLIGTLHSVFVVVQDMNQYPVDTTVTVTTEEYVLETKLILYQANRMLLLLF